MEKKILEAVKKAVKDDMLGFSKDPKFIELRDFYLSMQKAGIAVKQEYSLPSLDLVGRSLVPTDPV